MTRNAKRRRLIWGGFSVLAHAGLIAAILTLAPEPVRFVEPEAIPVALAPRYLPPPPEPEPPKLEQPKDKPAPPKPPAKVKPPPTLKVRKPVLKAPPEVKSLAVVAAKETRPGDEVSEAEVASAAVAGGGGSGGTGGGSCDMARLLQDKLRTDARVRAALSAVPTGRAVRVWNGDWVRHGEQEGAGLAAVREAIMWEVAWAPEACRKQRVNGLVLLTLNEGPPPSRVILGAGAWRWSDLLFSRSTKGRGG